MRHYSVSGIAKKYLKKKPSLKTLCEALIRIVLRAFLIRAESQLSVFSPVVTNAGTPAATFSFFKKKNDTEGLKRGLASLPAREEGGRKKKKTRGGDIQRHPK